MDGKVEVGKSTLKTFKTNLPKDKKESEEKKQKTNIIIYTDDAEFIFYNVSGSRVKSGDKIEEGTELGSVQGNGQEIAYAKRKETLDKDDIMTKPNILRNVMKIMRMPEPSPVT